MIRFLSGWTHCGGSTTAFINLVNALNEYGYDAILSGPHHWHLNKCRSEILSKGGKLAVHKDDIIVAHFLKIFKQRPPIKGFFLSSHEQDIFPLTSIDYSIFDKIHYVSEHQRDYHGIQTHPHFIIPNILDDLKANPKPSEKIAGIIGSVDNNKQVHKSIQRALNDGCDKVFIYGMISDPFYWQNTVAPLVDGNKVVYKGFEDNKQRMYDSITHVYLSSKRECLPYVVGECQLTNTELCGLSGKNYLNGNYVFDKKEIVDMWVEQLNIKKKVKKRMKKALVVADVDWWAFDKIYRGIRDNVSNNWQVDVAYVAQGDSINHIEYDVVLYLCDNCLAYLDRFSVPASKTIIAIRSHFHESIEKTLTRSKMVIASNPKLYDVFYGKHPNVNMIPGGVDTDKFTYQKKTFHDPIVIGWAGSRDGFGKGFRGLDIIQRVCDKMGFVFNPALREVRRRNENEMVDYYHNEIDIYVDMSESAGRQNGLVEAASCGVPVICTRIGIAEDIIKKNCGVLVDRTEEDLERALNDVIKNGQKYAKNIRKVIEDEWSWKIHAKMFEDMFEEIVS